MNSFYRGDTFIFCFKLQDDNGKDINFEVNDVVKFGMKKNIHTKEYSLYKEIDVKEETSEIKIEFSPEETQPLNITSYLIELELTREGYTNTIFQQEILIKGDVVRNVPEDNSSS